MLNYPRLTLVFSGAFAALGFAPTYYLPFLLLGFFALFKINQQAINFKTARNNALYFGFAYYLASLYWVNFALLVFIEDLWWLIPFAVILIPLILSVFFIPITISHYYWKNKPFLQALIVALIWVITEYIRSNIFTGFPWNLLASCLLIDLNLAQIIHYLGCYLTSGLIIFSILISFNTNKTKIYIPIICILLWCVIYYFGYQRINNYDNSFENTKIRIVQPAISMRHKWDLESFQQAMQKQINLSNFENDFKADIIIWPESAIITPINSSLLKQLSKLVLDSKNSILITGAIEEENNKIFTSMIGINNQGEQIFSYRKIHLLPFGEYVPFAKYLPMQKISPGLTDYSFGNDYKIISYQQIPKFKPSICYEIAFSDETKINIEQAKWILNITNDAWFGNSSGPHQHLALNQLRAIETGKPVIRCANNGISAVINAVGQIIIKRSINETAIIDTKLPKNIK